MPKFTPCRRPFRHLTRGAVYPAIWRFDLLPGYHSAFDIFRMQRMNGNEEWVQRSLAAVWHPCTQMKAHEHQPLLAIARGEGVWLYDYAGRRYLDGISSWWVNLFGHANPRINAALIDQLARIEHVMLAGATHAPAVELSERLAALAPGDLGHCFFGSDGASATEIALKMSFHYWQNRGRPAKRRFLCLQNGYHGETVGALRVTDVAVFRDTYAPLLLDAATMPSPDSRLRAPGQTAAAHADRCAEAVAGYLAEHHQEIAAFILEPLVQGAAGMAMYPPEYLARIRTLCSQYDVHLICDEIAVGFGRTGTMFASEQAGVTPDFLCLSKGITGGYLPLSAVLTTDEVYAAFYHDEVARGFLHSHSYTGNALACRAALATLDIFAADNVLAQNRQTAALLTARAEPLARHPAVRDFRHLGMIWAFEVEGADAAFAGRFFQKALERGLLLRPIGNTIYFMPPYVIREPEMEHLVAATLETLNATLLKPER